MRQRNYSIEDIKQRLSESMEALTAHSFRHQLKELLKVEKNPALGVKIILLLIGAIFTAVSFSGMMIGYMRAYNKFMRPKEELPRFSNLPLIVKASMAIGAVLAWAVVIGILLLAFTVFAIHPVFAHSAMMFIGINLLMSLTVFMFFRRWRISVWNLIMESDKNGTARFANADDLKEYKNVAGNFIGEGYAYAGKGHYLLTASSRGGKSKNLLMAHMLRVANYQGSQVYIDPKGECASVCANYLRRLGKRVVILNPWDLLNERLGGSTNYNPLRFISGDVEHRIDDVALVAELIVPIKHNDKNAFFTNSARNLIAGLLLHLVTAENINDPNLGILWEWLRLVGEDWDKLLADMYDNADPVNGQAVRMAASEIAKMMGDSETFSNIISNALEATNFLKSHVLRDSLQGDSFDPYSLTDGNTVVFVVIPFEKLLTYSNYLRLVVATLMRSIVRKPSKKNRTTFICDEAFSLGYMREFETAIAGYAGYNISLYLVYQDLNQIKGTYGEKWETVMANCGVRHFMSVRDVFSLEYISKMLGDKTRVMFKQNFFGTVTEVKTNHRPLATPSEVMRISRDNMLVFIDEQPPAVLPKVPYYEMACLKDENGNNLYDPNPYIENSL